MPTAQYSNQFILESLRGDHDIENDALVAILMSPTFVFNPTTHSTYADVSADEIASGNGYTQNTKALATVAISATAPFQVTAADVTWTAASGQIGPSAALIIYNSTHVSNTIICCIDFGEAYYAPDGDPFTIGLSAGFMAASPNVGPVAEATEVGMSSLLAEMVSGGYTEVEFDAWVLAEKSTHWGGGGA